jgi:putative MATE family efflux protein
MQGPLSWGVAAFGLPMVVGMLLYGAFNLVDLFMLSRMDDAAPALAALGICDMLFALAVIAASGISNSSVALISRRLGEGDREGMQRAAWQSLLLLGGSSLVLGVAGVWGAGWVVEVLMHAKAEVAVLATQYLQIMLGGSYSIFLLLQVTAILRALGHASWAAVLLVAGNGLNVVLDAIFIFGPGPAPELLGWAPPVAQWLGIPQMGMAGAAWATLLGRSVPMLLGLGLLVLLRDGLELRLRFLRLELRQQWRLLLLGWPASAQLALRVGTVLVFLALISASFTTADDVSVLTAYSICLRLEVIVLFMAMGWGAAASTYMGVNLGASQPQRALNSTWLSAAYAAASVLLVAFVAVLFAREIIAFFDDSEAVLEVGAQYFRVVAFSYVALAFGVVLSQGLTGAGDTLASFLLDAGVLLILVIPGCMLLIGVWGHPPVVLWWAMVVGNVLAAAVFALYFWRGRFVHKQV